MNTDAMGAGRFDAVDHVDQAGSTNDDLQQLAGDDPQTPRVLIADEQIAGRGRRDRTWTMPPGGGLLISFYVPWVQREIAHIVPTCLGNAAIAAISSAVDFHAGSPEIGLKWPNDIVDDRDRKLGGMLSTSVTVDGSLVGVVAGLGLNVSWPHDTVDAIPNATSLVGCGAVDGADLDRRALAMAMIRKFDAVLRTAETYGVVPIHDRYRRHCQTLGRTVSVQRTDGELVGIATDIDPGGSLVLDVDGKQHRVDVGDVVHVRPAGTAM